LADITVKSRSVEAEISVLGGKFPAVGKGIDNDNGWSVVLGCNVPQISVTMILLVIDGEVTSRYR
jgi:hypothetical protein